MDDTASVEQSGGVASVDTNQLFESFLSDTASVEQSGGVASVDTNQLFESFLSDTASVEQPQSGGDVASLDTNALFDDFVKENSSLQSGGVINLEEFGNCHEDHSEPTVAPPAQDGGLKVLIQKNYLTIL